MKSLSQIYGSNWSLIPMIRELLTLEYVLTHGYCEDENADLKRYLELQDILYK